MLVVLTNGWTRLEEKRFEHQSSTASVVGRPLWLRVSVIYLQLHDDIEPTRDIIRVSIIGGVACKAYRRFSDNYSPMRQFLRTVREPTSEHSLSGPMDRVCNGSVLLTSIRRVPIAVLSVLAVRHLRQQDRQAWTTFGHPTWPRVVPVLNLVLHDFSLIGEVAHGLPVLK